MLALCRLSPLQTWRTASTVAPTTWAGGLGACRGRPGCRRCRARALGSNAGRVGAGPLHRLDQAGVVHGGDQVVVGHRRRRPCRSRGRARRARAASRMVRSTRIGDIGWRGPEVVLGQRRVEDDRRRDPNTLACAATLPVACAAVLSYARTSAGGPPDGGPPIEHTLITTAAHGRPFCVGRRRDRPWALTPGAHHGPATSPCSPRPGTSRSAT